MGQAAGGKERQLAAQPPLTNGFAGGGDRLFRYRCLESLGHWWQHAAVSASNRSCSASAAPPGYCKPTSCSQSACVCLPSPAFRAWGRSEETGQYTRSGEEVCERANTPEQDLYLLVCVRSNRRSTSRDPSVWPPAGYPRACFCPVRKQSAWGRRVASGVRALCNNATDSCPFSTPESYWSPPCTHHKLPTSWMMPWSRSGKRSPRSHPLFHRGRPKGWEASVDHDLSCCCVISQDFPHWDLGCVRWARLLNIILRFKVGFIFTILNMQWELMKSVFPLLNSMIQYQQQSN